MGRSLKDVRFWFTHELLTVLNYNIGSPKYQKTVLGELIRRGQQYKLTPFEITTA